MVHAWRDSFGGHDSVFGVSPHTIVHKVSSVLCHVMSCLLRPLSHCGSGRAVLSPMHHSPVCCHLSHLQDLYEQLSFHFKDSILKTFLSTPAHLPLPLPTPPKVPPFSPLLAPFTPLMPSADHYSVPAHWGLPTLRLAQSCSCCRYGCLCPAC